MKVIMVKNLFMVSILYLFYLNVFVSISENISQKFGLKVMILFLFLIMF